MKKLFERRNNYLRKSQNYTLKFSARNQISLNLTYSEGYKCIQKQELKFCWYGNFGHIDQTFPRTR